MNERDMPECEYANMSDDELMEWADMGDRGAMKELGLREENEVLTREAFMGAI
jgi:hypothetical protein